MSTQSWGSKNPVKSEGEMSSSLALEAQRIVRHAAEPIPAGETVKGQQRRAARALGYRDGEWRIAEAWYGRAGCWSASAFDELRRRYHLWAERQAKGAEAEKQKLASVYLALAERLRGQDAEFFGSEIDRLIDVARRLGDENTG